jgi:hypothetical protein
MSSKPQQPKKQKSQKPQQNARKQKVAQSRFQRPAGTPGRALAVRNIASAHKQFGNQEGMALTELLAVPYNAPLQRMPTVDMPLTSIMRLRDALSYTSNAAGYFDAGDMVFTLYGQVGRTVEYGPVLPKASYTFSVYFSSTDSITPLIDWTYEPLNLAGTFLHTDEWPVADCRLTSGTTPSGQTHRAFGKSDSRAYMFLSGAERIVTANPLGTSTLTGSATFEVQKYGEDDTEPIALAKQFILTAGKIPAGSVLVDAAVTGSGYYAIKYTGTIVGSGTSTTPLSIQLQITNPTIATKITVQRYAPEIDQDAAIGKCVRRTACSMLLTNTTALNSRQGTVIAARLQGANYNTVTAGALNTAAGRYSGDAAMGCYTYLEFSTEDEKFVEARNGDYGGIFYNLDSEDYAHTVWMTNPGYASVQQSYALMIDTIIEFKTDSQKYERAVPHWAAGELIAARRIANATPFFYENPLHLADITRWVKQAWSAVRRNADPIAEAISYLAPVAGPAARAAAHYLRA